MNDLEILPCTIAAGQTVSAPVGIGTKTIVGLVIPAGWASGALTFHVSRDGSSYLPFVDVNNAAITIPAPAVGKKTQISDSGRLRP